MGKRVTRSIKTRLRARSGPTGARNGEMYNMAAKSKITELEKAIKDARAELTAIQQEKERAADDPAQLVQAEKQERRIEAQLKALEKTKAAATYTLPEPTDQAELLAGFQKYREGHAGKIAAVKASIAEAEQEWRAVMDGLERAANECDTKKTLELSEQKADLDRQLKHLNEMKERVEALPVYPAGTFDREWAAICDRTLPDWRRRVLQVETLANEYKAACASLLQMHDALKAARNSIERLAAAEGQEQPDFQPVFTAEIRGKALAVQKDDYIRLSGLATPIAGRAL